MTVEEFKRRILRELRELEDRFPEEWVAVDFDSTVAQEAERPEFLWRGGRRQCIILRWDDVKRRTLLLTPEGLFTAKFALTLPPVEEGFSWTHPGWCPNWREKKKADNLTWASYAPQVEVVLDRLRTEQP